MYVFGDEHHARARRAKEQQYEACVYAVPRVMGVMLSVHGAPDLDHCMCSLQHAFITASSLL